jgi:putative SOS response-associated peptidase YedK
MCYYNGQKVTRTEKIKLLQLEKAIAGLHLNRPVIDGFDYGNHVVLRPHKDKEDFDLVEMEWGFAPSWVNTRAELNHFRRGGINPKTGQYEKPFTTLNAIGNEMFDKKMFKESAEENHCLILSSGFVEWHHEYPVSKKTGRPLKTPVRYPYYIHLPDHEYFYMAGIYNNWTDKQTGEKIQTSAINTADANELLKYIHNSKERMPTILNEELAYEWIFGKRDKKRIIEIASTQFPYRNMYAYPLATDFLSSPDPLLRVDHPGLPPIPLPEYEKEYFIRGDNDFIQKSLFD